MGVRRAVALVLALAGCEIADDVVGIASASSGTGAAAESGPSVISAAGEIYQSCNDVGMCGCGITCGYGNQDVPPDQCTATEQCDYTCPGGGCAHACEIGLDDALGCTLECPDGGCALSCKHGTICRISVCPGDCTLTCNGAPDCSLACDAAAGCSITP